MGVPYDLILMDVQMPVMDGFTATKIIREQLHLQIPIIAMTAGVLAFERQQCIESGMNDFIGKPINVDSMILTIAKYLPAKATAQATELPRKMSQTESQVFDPEKVLKFVRGKPAREREVLAMISRIVDDGMKPLHEGRQLLGDGKLDEARRHFHTLKGAMGNFGAQGVFRCAQSMEDSIKNGHSAQFEDRLNDFEKALSDMLAVAADWLQRYPKAEKAELPKEAR